MKNFKNTVLSAVLTLAMATAIALPQAEVSSAATINFRDVDSSHWAQSSINFAVDKGIVKGYYDEYSKIYTFKPESSVTYEEATAMLVRALSAAGIIKNADADATAALVEKYQSQLEAAGIAAWARESVAVLLDRGIVAESELAAFVGQESIGNPAPRSTVARWTAKAIDRPLAAVYYLPYTDAASIAASDRAYADVLYRQGIMKGSLQMDGTTAFMPNAGVKRCEFAAIANRVYENRAGSYDYNRDIYTYDQNSQISSLYLADQLNVIVNGKTVQSVNGASVNPRSLVTAGTAFVISGIAADGGHTPGLHVDTAPARGKGTITKVESLGNGVFKVSIEVSDTAFEYIYNQSTTGAKPTRDQAVTFVADGVQLVELI